MGRRARQENRDSLESEQIISDIHGLRVHISRVEERIMGYFRSVDHQLREIKQISLERQQRKHTVQFFNRHDNKNGAVLEDVE